MPLVVGVDSSTQSTKVEARDVDTGRVVATGSAKHPPTSPPVSEQDPRAWWGALVSAMGQLGDHRREVVAISVAGQQHGLVLLDDAGAPVRPAKLWNDTTSASQAERLVLELGTDQWAALTCSVPVASFTISKLAWVAEHEPDTLARATRVMLPHDYLTWRLCGAHVTDRGDASGTGWFDPVSGDYHRNLLDLAVGRPWSGELPRVLSPTEVAGTVRGDALTELGLGGEVLVAAGSGDNMAAALGLGLRSGDVAISLGTSGTVFAVSATPTHATSPAPSLVSRVPAARSCRSCARSTPPRSPTPWPGGSARMPLGARSSHSPRRPTRARSPSCRTSMASEHPICPTPRARSSASRTPQAASSWRSPPTTVSCAGCCTASRRFATSAPPSTAAPSSLAAGRGHPHTGSAPRIFATAAIVVPETDETVATGAAVQAAAIASGRPLDTVAERWSLGRGTVVEPGHDASSVRIRYAAARSTYASH